MGESNQKRSRILFILIMISLFFLMIYFALQARKTYQYQFKLSDFKVNAGKFNYENASIEGLEGSEYFAESTTFTLPKGDYVLHVQYCSNTDGSVFTRASNDCVFSFPLPNTSREISVAESAFSLLGGTDKGKIHFSIDGSGTINVLNVWLSCNHMIYTDYVFYIALLLFVCILISFSYFQLQTGRWNPDKIKLLYGMIFIAMILCVSSFFFEKGLSFCIDTRAQLLRIEGLRGGLLEGQFPVIINPNYCNGYGELGALYPGVLLYIPAVLRIMGVSMMTSYKTLMILINIGVAGIMYITAKSIVNSSKWAMAASIIYSFEAYRLYNIKGGGGTGTGAALVFLPLVIAGLYHIIMGDRKKWSWLSIGVFGMFASHLLTTVFACIFAGLFCLVNIRKCLNKEVIMAFLKAVGLFILLGMGFLLPFLGYYFTDWNKSALQWSDFYTTTIPWSQIFTEAFSILTLVFIIAAGVWIFMLVKKGEKPTRFCVLIFISIVITYLMTTPMFPWRILGKVSFIDALVKMAQFSDRVLAFTSALIALLAGVLLSMQQSKKMRSILIILFSGMVIYSFVFSYQYYIQRDVLLHDAVTGDINTKAQEDYLPAGTLSEYYATDTGDISNYYVVQSLGYQKLGTHITYQYTCKNEGEYIEAPLFYYKGYEAVNEAGVPLKIEKGTKNRVRVYLEKSINPKTVIIQYRVSRIYQFGAFISLATGMLLVVYMLKQRVIKPDKQIFDADRHT